MNDADGASVVLLVDDDTARARRAGRAIERTAPPVDVSVAEPGSDAVSAASEPAIRCVVTAWGRADGDGESFLSALRDRRPSVPVVLFTDVDLVAVDEAAGAYDVADVRPRTPDGLADRLLAGSVAGLIDEVAVEPGSNERPTGAPRKPAGGGVRESGREGEGSPGGRDCLHDHWYRRLVEQNIVGIYVIEDRVFSYVNSRMADVFGTTPTAMEGRPVMSFVAPEDRCRVDQHLADREADSRERAHYVFTGICADGTRIEVEASGGRIAIGDGVAIVGVLLDVTERERHEREIRRLSRAVEHAAPAIYVTDADGLITDVNPAFERITGYDSSRVVGENPRLLNSERMDDDYYDEMYATINGGDVWREAIVDRRANGELYHARQTIAPIHENDRIEGFVAIQEDVTEERIRQQVLQVLHRVLRHNLRNKLNVIAGHAAVLAERLAATGDDTGLASATAIQRATAELDELSDRATEAEFALESSGSDRRPIDLVALLRRQWGQFVDEEHGTDLLLDGPDCAWVTADATLTVAVRELLRAAVSPTRDRRSPTTTTVRHAGTEVELRLRLDETAITEWHPIRTGIETPLEHASGLDMWLAEWVVTRLGGDLRLSDADGESLLIVRLPEATAPDETERQR
ncbi:PAS domain S-box protein [Salinigranum marinum]|uniref:PAS domain S-box protein n=1 Tax=Salinigranum marinum TaxID=1515595 RepID=UPI002989D629|nr:PAS domain S-box protein [Salinigranum marinum]